MSSIMSTVHGDTTGYNQFELDVLSGTIVQPFLNSIVETVQENQEE